MTSNAIAFAAARVDTNAFLYVAGRATQRHFNRAIFGEMAVLDGSARSATVTARGETTLFKFPRADFQDLVEGGSLAAYKLVYAMARVLCQRQRAITQQLSDVIEAQPAEQVVRCEECGRILVRKADA